MSHSQKPSTKKNRDLLVLGDLCLDIDVYASRNEYQSKRASRINLNEGGSAGNVAFAADQLGLTTGLAAPIAQDTIGIILESLVRKRHTGVTLQLINNPNQVTCTIVNLINKRGARRPYYQKNEAICKLDDLIEPAAKYRWLHMSGYTLELFDLEELINFLQELKTFKVQISLDLFPRIGIIKRSKPQLDLLLREIDLLFGNLREFKDLTESNTLQEITQKLATKKTRAIIKMGSRGAIYKSPKETISSPPNRVTPINLKGAGDVFIAAFLASHIVGNEIKTSLQKANTRAGLHIAGLTTKD